MFDRFKRMFHSEPTHSQLHDRLVNEAFSEAERQEIHAMFYNHDARMFPRNAA